MIRTLHKLHQSRPHLAYALAIGVIAGFVIPLRPADPVMQALIGWNVTNYLYLVVTWFLMLRADASDVRGFAEKQYEKAYVILVALSLAAMVSLIAIVIELAGTGATSSERPFHIAMTAITILGAWLLIPTVFGLHYAHEYYQAPPGVSTLIFPDADLKPDYWDFQYFAFTIAVAFATSDVAIGTRAMRKAVLAQAVMAFFFNTSILALSINIAASLVGR